MSPTLLHSVVRVADARTPDADLLDRFIHDKDEAAFEELVRRHGPLVWSVCRQLLPHHADAEDAFQAVFLALARGAGSIRAGQALPAWLHGVAVRVAARAKRAAVRRRQREERAAVPEADRPVPDAAWSTLMAAVHEEVQQLPESERTAFVLCDLEGVRQPDAAARLGWPLGTLSGRLCKARQKLLDQLTRRGIAPAVLALGGLAGTAGSVPAALLKQVHSFPTAAAAGIPSTVAALAGGLLEGVTMRTKLMAAALVVAGALGVTGGAMVLSKADAQSGSSSGGAPPGQGTTTSTSSGGGQGTSTSSSTVGQSRGGTTSTTTVGQQGGPTGSGSLTVTADPTGGQPHGLWVGGGQGEPGTGVVWGHMAGQGGQGGGPMVVNLGAVATHWEYKFVDLKSDDRAAFEKEITTAGNDRWEYVGSERLRRGNDTQITLVFKRPKGGGLGGAMGMGGLGGGGLMGGMPGGGGFGGNLGGSGFGGFGGGGFGGGGGKGGGGGGDGVAIESRVIKLKNANANDVAAAIEKAFPKHKTLKVVAEPVSNTVVIVADPPAVKDVVKLIESLDGKPGEGPKQPGGGDDRGGGRPPAGGGGGRGGAGGPPGMGGGGPGGVFGGSPGAMGPMGGVRGGPPMGGPGGDMRPGTPIQVLTLRHATARGMAEVLNHVFPNVEITPDPRTNQLIVRGSQDAIAEVAKLAEKLDVDAPKK